MVPTAARRRRVAPEVLSRARHTRSVTRRDDVSRQKSHTTRHAGCRDAFLAFDKDRSGGLDTRELGKALRQLGMESDSQQTIAVLQRFDKDGGGTLDVYEFHNLVQARCFVSIARSLGHAAHSPSPASSPYA